MILMYVERISLADISGSAGIFGWVLFFDVRIMKSLVVIVPILNILLLILIGVRILLSFTTLLVCNIQRFQESSIRLSPLQFRKCLIENARKC